MKEMSYSTQNLQDMLEKRFLGFTFHIGFGPIQNWFLRLIGWPGKNYCCGVRMEEFHAIYKSSGIVASDAGFYGCHFCGRVE